MHIHWSGWSVIVEVMERIVIKWRYFFRRNECLGRWAWTYSITWCVKKEKQAQALELDLSSAPNSPFYSGSVPSLFVACFFSRPPHFPLRTSPPFLLLHFCNIEMVLFSCSFIFWLIIAKYPAHFLASSTSLFLVTIMFVEGLSYIYRSLDWFFELSHR